MSRPSQISPFIQGDLNPRMTDFVDLRNDNGGSATDQYKSIVLRFLETVGAKEFVGVQEILDSVSQHWPHQGTGLEVLQDTVDSLKKDGLVISQGDKVQINKVARVAHRWVCNGK